MNEKKLSEETPFEIMRRTWQPVALSRDVPAGAIAAFRLLGREIVIARLATGLVAADDACPHKGFRLSLSRACGGELMCAYHGWRFDGQGRCVGIPSLPEASVNKLQSAGLQTYAVREDYGHIWVQLEQSNGDDLPVVPEFEDGWTFLPGPPTPFACGWRREVENFLDMTHFAFAHGSTLGAAADTRVPQQHIEMTRDGFTMQTEFPSLTSPHEQPGKLSSAHRRFYRTWLPNFTVIRQSWPDGDERLLWHMPVPHTQTTCTVFWGLAISPDFDGPPPQAQLDFAVRVLEEDRQMCENQLPLEVPLNPSRGGWGVLVAPGDTLANTFQRSFRKWLTEAVNGEKTCQNHISLQVSS